MKATVLFAALTDAEAEKYASQCVIGSARGHENRHLAGVYPKEGACLARNSDFVDLS